MIEFSIDRDSIQDKETAIKAAKIFILIEERRDVSFEPTLVFYDTEGVLGEKTA